MKGFCKICDGPLVEAARQKIGRCRSCRPEIKALWSGSWQWRSCTGTDDARQSPVYRVTDYPGALAWNVAGPGPVEASTCADPPREMKGGGGLYIGGMPKFCGLDDALVEDA